jgi:hypothetical protein
MDEDEGVDLRAVKLDLRSVTLGEMVACELASGQDFDRLMATNVTQKVTWLYIEAIRRASMSSAPAPSWSELTSRLPRGKRSSALPSSPDGHPTTAPE